MRDFSHRKGRFIAQRPTTNESPKSSHSEAVVSIENQYLEINPQNVGSYYTFPHKDLKTHSRKLYVNYIQLNCHSPFALSNALSCHLCKHVTA